MASAPASASASALASATAFHRSFLPTRQTKTGTTQTKRNFSEIFYQARVVRAFQI